MVSTKWFEGYNKKPSDDVSAHYSKSDYMAGITIRKRHGGDDQGSQVLISKHYQSSATLIRVNHACISVEFSVFFMA